MKNERTCWPRQIRGPALKGRKMNEFLTRYFLTRSSRKRSGSNSSAVYCVYNSRSTEESVALTIRSPEIFASMHHEDRICNSDKASELTISSPARTYFVPAGI